MGARALKTVLLVTVTLVFIWVGVPAIQKFSQNNHHHSLASIASIELLTNQKLSEWEWDLKHGLFDKDVVISLLNRVIDSSNYVYILRSMHLLILSHTYFSLGLVLLVFTVSYLLF